MVFQFAKFITLHGNIIYIYKFYIFNLYLCIDHVYHALLLISLISSKKCVKYP